MKTIDNTLYSNLKDIIFDIRTSQINTLSTEATKKIKMVKNYNPLKSKPGITLIEAHLRLNHVPAKVIRNSIQMNIFEDVVEIKEKKKKNNLWCETFCAGKMTRNYY